MPLRTHHLDGAIVQFDRDARLNVLRRGPSTASSRRVSPRTLQIGLLTPCNLRCSFCYRDKRAPSRLTAPFLVELLRKCAEWGVLEVAFGGGEPLLFDGFVELLEELHRSTPLGVAFTTNGTLLTDAIVERVKGVISELRVSAYPDNGYRNTLARVHRQLSVGINWLVTPKNVGLVDAYVHDFLERGARNVLLLGYKGDDPTLHLQPKHFDVLRRALTHLEGAPLRLDVCWYPHLPDVPHLFPRSDCGASDEFLVITPDRAVQACSFANARRPFADFDELRAIYDELRSTRPSAGVLGCTRSLFAAQPLLAPAREEAWTWEAAASNNSADWTISARFCDAETAERVAASLRELARAHEAFLASPEGQAWTERNGYDGSYPTPVLARFGEAHGFDWSGRGEGLWWEENGYGAPLLTAGAVGDAVVVYHPYCMGLPVRPFRELFTRAGALEFDAREYDAPFVVVTARGRSPAAEKEIAEHFMLVNAAEHAHDVNVPPPWGPECADPRLADEDRGAKLRDGPHVFERTADGIRMRLQLENTFAGVLALDKWLSGVGFDAIEVRLESAGVPLVTTEVTSPKVGLFGDVRPLADVLPGATPSEIVRRAFQYQRLPAALCSAIAGLPPGLAARLCHEEAERHWSSNVDVTEASRALLAQLEPSPERAAWARATWDRLEANHRLSQYTLTPMTTVLPLDECVKRGLAWVDAAGDVSEREARLFATAGFSDSGWLDRLESVRSVDSQSHLGTLWWVNAIALQGLPWERAKKWLSAGRPLSLLAVSVLEKYAEEGAPPRFGPPAASELSRELEQLQTTDGVPRVKKAVARILRDPSRIVRGS